MLQDIFIWISIGLVASVVEHFALWNNKNYKAWMKIRTETVIGQQVSDDVFNKSVFLIGISKVLLGPLGLIIVAFELIKFYILNI